MPPAPTFPLKVFYDGACMVCAGEIERYRRRDRAGRLVPIDISHPDFDPRLYGISRQAFQYELHAIDRQGTVYRGIEAFRAIWLAFPDAFPLRALALLVNLPLISFLARRAYRSFARMRHFLPKNRSTCHSANCRVGHK